MGNELKYSSFFFYVTACHKCQFVNNPIMPFLVDYPGVL